jgi:protein-S-isoprenylcysteine O-methyltransferase Ste14
VVAWLALPFLSAGSAGLLGTVIIPSLVHPVGRALGLIMMAAGYAGTLWCYVAMGNAWRMGAYRLVRHPIYLCQVVMVAAIVVLLPSVLSRIILIIHLLCVSIKAADEESHLRALLGRSYEAYCAHTGRWLPPLLRRESPAAQLSAADPDHKKSANPPFK